MSELADDSTGLTPAAGSTLGEHRAVEAGRSLPVVEQNPNPSSEAERQAALRQFSVARLQGYGVAFGDASDLRTMVERGGSWGASASLLAEEVLSEDRRGPVSETAISRRNRLRRGSALLRMSQMMDLRDTSARAATYERAAQLIEDAFADTEAVERTIVGTRGGPLAAWILDPPHVVDAPIVVIIGGVEGWAMDLLAIAEGLVARGISALALDGPGQGESRLLHKHYLTADWVADLTDVVSWVQGRTRGPVGILGNSVGGSLVPHVASNLPLIRAVVNNGGPPDPLLQKSRKAFFPKMEAFLEPRARQDDVVTVWGSVRLSPAAMDFPASYLVVHGESDPLVSDDEVRASFALASSADKQLSVFAEGDHCVNTHHQEKIDFVSDWLADRLC